MGDVKWTEEQIQAIKENGTNILVSAAAGSGKTAVLVERMINKIINNNVDIDKILIATFTSPAASEMRERILEAIYKKLEEEPSNMNLQKQLILLNKANISTIHSFCLNVIKNNFFEIGISPDFRIAEPSEIELMKMEVLEELLEELYERRDESLIKISEIYSGYKGDDGLIELIFKIYNYIQSAPFPIEWLNEQIEKFNLKEINQDFSETEWGKILLENFYENILNNIQELEIIKNELNQYSELEKYHILLSDDIEQHQNLIRNIDLWDKTYQNSLDFSLKTWPSDKKITLGFKDIAKERRGDIRDNTKKIIGSTFNYTSEEANKDISEMYSVLILLKNIVELFDEKFKMEKQAKNVLDFNDIEHYALKILTKKNEDGILVKSDVAKKYSEYFNEVAIDEYQDSNMVQETILNSVSNGKNLFMVGDVKQSIYKFRQAMPEIFLKKYHEYKMKEDLIKGDSLKIKLFNNFRSREIILEFANKIFANIMSEKIGDINYNEAEYLNYKANYEPIEQKNNIEVHIIDNNKQEETTLESEDIEQLENTEIEARFIARKIDELVESGYKVWDKKEGYRKIKYKDIVILLRSPNAVADIYEKELEKLNISVFSDTNIKYLDSIEIETIINLLKIIDNPLQDIPLVSVLRSYIGNFTDNELVEIRLADRNCLFYEALLKAKEVVRPDLGVKVDSFLKKLQQWQCEHEYFPLNEFIWKIYIDTGYLNYVSLMPNGEFRQANLKMLFEQAKKYESVSFKGLFNFIKFIERLKKNNGDLSAAKLIGENEDVVRIMSIHKSKGLEFPVVFLSGTGKNFNFKDLNDNILLHQSLGIGTKYINYEKKISYNTLARQALKVKMKNEIVSEEMRLLYVALTRSKEKLIITGVVSEAEKKKKRKMEILENKAIINYLLVKKYRTYIDWIELVVLKEERDIDKILVLKYYKKTDLEKQLNNNEEKEISKSVIDEIRKMQVDNEKMDTIRRSLSWEYENVEATRIEGKTSVSNIVKPDIHAAKLQNLKSESENRVLTKAEIGSVIHLVLQNISLDKIYTIKDLEQEVQNLLFKNILTEKEFKNINLEIIYKFTSSNIAKRIRNSSAVYKEKPFYKNVKANVIYETDCMEDILVQGIIDLYFVENGEIVLLDYKTDNVKNEEELVNRYQKQLYFYRTALEESTKMKVKEIIIYSLSLNREIKL